MRKVRVLVVDDVVDMRRPSPWISTPRVRATVAGSGTAASRSPERPDDVVVTDSRMKNVDGSTSSRRQRRRPEVPVLLMTAFGGVESAVEPCAAALHY